MGQDEDEAARMEECSVIYSEGERKYTDITLDLVRNELLNLAEYNVHMVKVAAKPGSSEPLPHLVEIIKNPATSIAAISGVNVGKEDKARLARDKKVS
ncbi:CCR4-NOT transcription complex subunit 1 isoform X2 [Cucumis melo var. makuwa]|uniref:CCR4-NOT transcription complex subunit 1 isoform X2 n=1 Tax=Cucumis melo var. makuwa TaxID=1194695 RepID=A0A5A7UEP8_CUCMM|nr:CCR4-NOT transcription complex subunit 1 isoform X2 [Cucumis melo var. makuwa]TYK13995.1 CCR4-NOT transcription complex subunit 1 isoform X2 [Cucumis melo var. makuwa]